jgi:filamentous hemagglutinin family protein
MKTLNHPFVRFFHKSVACLLAFCMINLPVWALNANDATVAAGNANKSQVGNTVSVDLVTNRAVLDWTQMNATNSETLNFTGGSGFAVLNRVASSVNFNGTLNGAGGRIYVISPNGVLLGPDAKITATAFTAAGMNISNQNFMDGIDKFQPFAGGVVGNVTNYAVIDGVTDQVSLLGKTVINEGVISMPSGGVAVMAAGDNVYLGTPGGKVIVEMSGIEDGSVVNNGTINTPAGTIILAAGDIYSIPLHPQLKVNTGTVDVPVYNVEDQPVRVETGFGTVEQNGTIHADGVAGDGGSVIMTAGDSVYLRSGSLTTANGGISTDGSISADGGQVIAHAYDFGNKSATTYFEKGALIEVKGGSYDSSLMVGDILQVDPTTSFDGGFAGLNGNHIFFNGSINAVATANPYTIEVPNPINPAEIIELTRYPEGGTIQIDPVNLAIANGGIPAGGAAIDTMYEKQIEMYSKLGVNFDLAADEMITVAYMADGEIWGGSGDIMLRNVYDTGGIYFQSGVNGQRTTLHTTANFESGTGGNLYMIAGGGGIVAGDLKTDTLSPDKVSNPGRIRLLATNGGDIEVGSMIAERGNITEISAIASGNLTVNGEVISDNRVVDKQDKIIGFARICLVALEDVYVNAEGGPIKVTAHGKIASLGEIVICAGENITIVNLGKDGIKATAQTSENSPYTTSLADVKISAGGNQDTPATISINGDVYDQSATLKLPVYLESKASGTGSSVKVNPQNNKTQTSENTWYQEKIEENNYDLKVSLMINNDQTIPPGTPESPCYGCPTPEGLPPVPHIFWIMDDFIQTSNKTTQTPIDAFTQMLNNDDNGAALDGFVLQFTSANGGTLVPVYDGKGNITGFEYTPPAGAQYVVDAGDPTVAYYTDTFTYNAKDAEGNVSLNYATVTIQVKNNVPVAQSDSYTESHNVQLDVDGTTIAGVITGVVPATNGDYDLDADSLSAVLIGGNTTANGGTVVFNPDGTFTYTPSSGNTTGTDSFTYYVTDGYNNSQPATVTISLTNANPVAYDNSYGVSHNVELTVNAGDGTITGTLNGVLADYDPDNNNANKVFEDTLSVQTITNGATANGGTVTLNADGSFTYTPSSGNTTGTDSFTYTLVDSLGATDTATVTITLTNQAPIAQPDGYGTQQDVTLIITQPDDVITGVIPSVNGDYDPDNSTEGRVFDDTLKSYLPGGQSSGTTLRGGTIVLNEDGTFTYTPPAGATGEDSFIYYVTDGYDNSKMVTVTIMIEANITPELPIPPLADLRIPELKGCPALMDAAAAELAINSDDLQLLLANALASNPNLQPCDACEQLLNASGILRDTDGQRMAALSQIFSTVAPSDAPFTPEISASVATAFADLSEDDPQYALASDYVDAFVSYVAALERDLKSPVGDPVALVMEKYGQNITGSDNPNIAAYILSQLNARGTMQ